MTDTTPVGRIVALLESAGYRRMPPPLVVAGLKFEFQSVLLGPKGSADLILVADTAYDQESRLLQQVQGVARALDIARSTRPLTLVIAGPRPSPEIVDGLSKACRVLPVGTLLGDDLAAALRNWLAVLLPLQIPEPGSAIANPLEQILAKSSQLSPEILSLIPISLHGRAAVQRELNKLIDGPFLDEDDSAS